MAAGLDEEDGEAATSLVVEVEADAQADGAEELGAGATGLESKIVAAPWPAAATRRVRKRWSRAEPNRVNHSAEPISTHG